jgi:Myb-like DNA-binding protein FlbD
MASHRRGPWLKAEDEILIQLVRIHGPHNWVKIAQSLCSRTKKQCRERYHQALKPNLNHRPITPEEGAEIERLVFKIGRRWAEIARHLHGRSDNAVKNWWNGSQKRRKGLDHLDRHRATRSSSPCDEYYPRSLQTAGCSLPFPPPNSMQSSIDDCVTWRGSSLPSPCSSESPGSETCVHYRTSPRRIPAPSQSTVELPPLRTWTSSGGCESALPSLNLFGYSVAGEVGRRHLTQSHGQLETAPSSAVKHLLASSTKDRDSRMNISTLLM